MSGRDWQKARDRDLSRSAELAERPQAQQKRYDEVKSISQRSPRRKNWNGPSKLPRDLEQKMVAAALARKRANAKLRGGSSQDS